jgi:hypothetical protein
LTHYPYLNSADDVRVSLTVAEERLVVRIVEQATPALLPPGPSQLTLTSPPQPARHCAFQSEVADHKVLTYVEHRAVSGVFQNIDPPPPPSPPSECVLPYPAPKAGGTHSPGGEGVGSQYLEDARHWIGLLQFNPSTWQTEAVRHERKISNAGRKKKNGLCRNRSMQTGSSGTLIGWKSGQTTTYVPLWDRMEGAWLWWTQGRRFHYRWVVIVNSKVVNMKILSVKLFHFCDI